MGGRGYSLLRLLELDVQWDPYPYYMLGHIQSQGTLPYFPPLRRMAVASCLGRLATGQQQRRPRARARS
jgi:hypothetical protein